PATRAAPPPGSTSIARRSSASWARRADPARARRGHHRPRPAPSSRSAIVDRELDEVVVGIADVHAGRRTARARPGSGSGLDGDAGLLQELEDLVDRAAPLETEVGASGDGPPGAEVAGARRRVRPVDVNLLRLVDPDRRHVRAARALLPGDGEAEPLVESKRPLEITRHDDPVVDALDRHRSPPPGPAVRRRAPR